MASVRTQQTRKQTTYAARAFAKVNLHLAVGPARDDGFHELVTIFQSLDLADVVSIEISEPSAAPVTGDAEPLARESAGTVVTGGTAVTGLSVSGRDSHAVPTDASNLAWKAVDAVVQALRQIHGADLLLPKVKIVIEKNIPVAGGMAGGSADAAAALRAANALFSEYGECAMLDERTLHELAAQLGSDIPFCLHGHTAVGQGRGEKLYPLPTTGKFHWALLAHEQGLSTPHVFRAFDELAQDSQPNPTTEETADLAAALLDADVHQVAQFLRNDLQAAALHVRADLRASIDAGVAAGALAGVISGSGPTCAFLCADEFSAARVAAHLESTIAGTRGITATSPAGCAELIEH